MKETLIYLLKRNKNQNKIKYIKYIFNKINKISLNNINDINNNIYSILDIKRYWKIGHLNHNLDCLETTFIIYNLYRKIKLKPKIYFGKLKNQKNKNHFWLELDNNIIDFTLYQYKNYLIDNNLYKKYKYNYSFNKKNNIYKGYIIKYEELKTFLIGEKINRKK